MNLVVFEPKELMFVLGALRTVALADGATSQEERALVESVARLHGVEVAFDAVAPRTAEEVATVIVDPHRRKRCVQLAIVAALAAGPPSVAREEAVLRLGKVMGQEEDGLRVLHDMSRHHIFLARFDVLRRVRKFMVSHDKLPSLGEAALIATGLGEDAALAAKYHALASYPEGSFGRAVYDHYVDHGFALPGESHAVGERILFHDLGHVLSGYDVDPQGEIQQAAFQAGFVRDDGFLFLLFGILQFHLGVRVTPIAKSEHGFFDVDRVMRAAARGAACKVDLSDPSFDFWEHARTPLSDLREQFGVTPA